MMQKTLSLFHVYVILQPSKHGVKYFSICQINQHRLYIYLCLKTNTMIIFFYLSMLRSRQSTTMVRTEDSQDIFLRNFRTIIHGRQRIDPTDFDHPQIINLVPPVGQIFNLSHEISPRCIGTSIQTFFICKKIVDFCSNTMRLKCLIDYRADYQNNLHWLSIFKVLKEHNRDDWFAY